MSSFPASTKVRKARGAIASWFVERFDLGHWLNHGHISFGFLILFAAAGGIGLYSLKLLRNQPERPKIHAHDDLREHYRAPFRDRNFLKLIFFVIWWMLAIGIGSPFWVPFMLKNLQMGMVEIQIYGTCSLLTALLFIRPWGRFIDRFGNRTAMGIIILFSSMAPVPWLFVTPETLWLIYAEGAYAGAIYAGLGIVTTNFVLSIAPRGMQPVRKAPLMTRWLAEATCFRPRKSGPENQGFLVSIQAGPPL